MISYIILKDYNIVIIITINNVLLFKIKMNILFANF